ncbi:hypothetical protein ABZ079_23770 [Streptomyces sp. NPDC006314]|uniref:hypothetical protein n=1 Tax=Streptomyces sp. NPDC006314 TaxID=3154475 RepID=UPI0033A5A09A
MRRLFAVSAVGVLMAGGAAVGLAGTASAATPANTPTNNGCFYHGGSWYDHCDGFGNRGDRGDFYRSGVLNSGVVVIVVG